MPTQPVAHSVNGFVRPAFSGFAHRGGGDHLAFAALDRVATLVTLGREEILVREGDPAEHYFKVGSGALRSCKLLANGRRHIGDFLLPGDLFGLNAAARHAFTAEAVTASTLLRYSRRSVDALVAREPEFGRCLLARLCRDLTTAQQQRLLLGRKSAVERVATFLHMMAERRGGGDRLTLPMSRTDIGDHLGLTSETVSRALTQLRNDGIIELQEIHEVVLTDRAALEALAEAA